MNNIKYEVLIDNKPNELIYLHESKGEYLYHTDGILSEVHSFPWPLGKIPLNEHFKHNKHTYEIKTKP